MQAPEILVQIPLVLVHRHPVDSRARRTSLPFERSSERRDIYVMQQHRESGLARPSGRRVHPQKVRQQGLPALCLALRLLLRDASQPAPFLHHLVAFGDFIDVGSGEAAEWCSATSARPSELPVQFSRRQLSPGIALCQRSFIGTCPVAVVQCARWRPGDVPGDGQQSCPRNSRLCFRDSPPV